MCFEVVWVLESFTDDSVVVDLAIDSKCNALIAVGERLSSRIDANNGQTFVGEHCIEFSITPLTKSSRCMSSHQYGWPCSFQTNLDPDAYIA